MKRGHTYLRGSVYWIQYYRHGRRYRESANTDKPKTAEKLLEKRLGEISTGTFSGPAMERVTVDELAKATLRDYKINGKKSLDDVEARWRIHLEPFFSMTRAVEVSSDRIAKYVDQRQGEGASNATCNRELAFLKRAFRLGYAATPPKVARVPHFPHLREDNVRTGFLEDGQYQKIIKDSELWFRTLVECGRFYGWRISELLNLKVSQVDLAQRRIRLEPGSTKNKEGRQVAMTTDIFTLLTAACVGKSADKFVFTRPNGEPVKDFRATWRNACERAGLPNLLFHDLRRTAARNFRRAGIAEGVIMKITGHKTRSVFERYNIVNTKDTDAAIVHLEQQEAQQESQAQATAQPTPATEPAAQTYN